MDCSYTDEDIYDYGGGSDGEPYLLDEGDEEIKFFDKTLAATVIDTAGVLESTMNDLEQGTLSFDRLGRKVTLRQIEVRGEVVIAATATRANTTNKIRLIWYIDTQTNGVVATTTGLLATANVDSMRSLPNQSRFYFLYDKTFEMNTVAGGNADFGASGEHFQFVRELELPIEFSGTTGVLTEIMSNNIGCLMIAERALSSTVGWHSRVRFTDK